VVQLEQTRIHADLRLPALKASLDDARKIERTLLVELASRQDDLRKQTEQCKPAQPSLPAERWSKGDLATLKTRYDLTLVKRDDSGLVLHAQRHETWDLDFATALYSVSLDGEIKALTDYCVTSSNAVKVVQHIFDEHGSDTEILFGPDMWLGAFVEKRPANNVLLTGARGTGKSYAFQEISPYVILLTGPTTVANLFYNMATGKMGLVGMWDSIAFDEVADLQKMPD